MYWNLTQKMSITLTIYDAQEFNQLQKEKWRKTYWGKETTRQQNLLRKESRLQEIHPLVRAKDVSRYARSSLLYCIICIGILILCYNLDCISIV